MKKQKNEMKTKKPTVIHRKDCVPPPVRLRSDYHIKSPSLSEAKEMLNNIRDLEKQPPASVNVHQKEMDKIANDMAVLFEKKITATELAKWLVIANTHSNPHDSLIWSLGYTILPGLIDAKNQAHRINLLKKELPHTYDDYQFANRSLFQLGEDYFKENKGLGFFVEQVEEFLSVYLPLLSICEKFEIYEHHQKELRKELDNAA
jgi:hypothetical protein